MTVTVDLNVLLDVFQRRQPHYAASARVVDLVETGNVLGVCPAHGLTTLYYVIRRHASRPDAEAALDRVPRHFQIGNLDAANGARLSNIVSAGTAAIPEPSTYALALLGGAGLLGAVRRSRRVVCRA